VLFLGSAPSAGTLLYMLGAGVGALALGVLVFRRMERDLAVIL
jgi:hypothetical protein